MKIKKVGRPFCIFATLLVTLALLLVTGISATSTQDIATFEPTAGFQLSLNEDARSFSIVKYTGTETDVVLPLTQGDLPITALGPNVFFSDPDPDIASGGDLIILPEDTLAAIPTRITILSKNLIIPDDPAAFPKNATIVARENSTAHAYATKYARAFEELPTLPTIISASILLGSDITVNYTVDLGGASMQDAVMRFTINGTTTTVTGVPKAGTDYHTFSIGRIYPHTMGNNISAALVVDGTVVDVLDTYSVRQYCLNMLDRIADKSIDAYTDDAQYSLLKTLIADLLQYGADAQIFTGYNTDAPVNSGITGMSTYTPPSEAYSDIPLTASTASDGSRLVSVKPELSNVIKLGFTFATPNVSSVTLRIGNKSYGSEHFISTGTKTSDGLPVYLLYSEAIYATEIEDIFDVTLCVDGKDCQHLQYGVLHYVYRKQNDANTALAALVRSIRNYGGSAMNMYEYSQKTGTVALYVANESAAYTDALYQAMQQKFSTVELKNTSDDPSAIFDTASYDAVVVAGMDALSYAAADAMNAYLNNSGRVLLLGGPAMEKPLVWNGEAVTLADYREHVIGELASDKKQTLLNVSSSLSFSSANGTAHSQSAGNYGLSGSTPQRYLKADNVVNWATFQKSVSPTVEGANVISFYAKAGDDRTDIFQLEVAEANGGRWRLRVPMVGDGWTHYAFTPEEFVYYTGDATAADRAPIFQNIVSVKINFEESFSRISQGEHSLYISNITLSAVEDEAFHRISSDLGSLYGVAPLYEQYPITNAADISADAAQIFVADRDYVIPTGTNALVSCYAGITADGYGKSSDTRFIPLLTVTDEQGLVSGYAAWIDVYASTSSANADREGAMVGYFGATTDEFYNTDGIAAVVEAAAAMTGSVFIVDGGTTERTYIADETESVTAGIKFVTLGDTVAKDTVASVSLYEGAKIVATYSSKDLSALSLANSIQAIEGTYALSNGKPDRAVATVSVNGRVVDRVEQAIHFWSPKPEKERHYIHTEDGYFKRDGQIISFFGVNYFPSYSAATPHPYTSFVSKDGYNPTVIQNDLKRLLSLGMNAISIQSNVNAIKESNNLLDFLRICDSLGIYVDISLSQAYPLTSSLLHNQYNYNATTVETSIRKLHLHELDNIIAYDITWESRIGNYLGGGGGAVNGRYIGRKDWDDDFTAWIKDQYGSVSAAQTAWGTSASLTNGNLVVTDAMLDDTTGTYRKMIAAYYRFIDDIVSTSMETNLSHLESIAPDQLISFRMSMSGSTHRTDTFKPSVHCFDFQSLASSMAFMQPEGYQLSTNTDSLLQIPFANAYARYTQPDSPVVWKEYGKSVWSSRNDGNFYPSEAFINDVSQYYASVLEYCYQSYTSGMFCWWSVSGFRINEYSDYGIFNPDGSDRGGENGITALLREYAPKFINQGARVAAKTQYIRVDRDDYVGGLFGMFDEVMDDLATAHKAGKHVVFIDGSQASDGSYAFADTLTNSFVADAVTTAGKAPLRYVNGIVKSCTFVTEGGKTYADVTVCNTKQSIWRADTVSLISSNDNGASVNYTITEDVQYLEDVTVRIDVTGMSSVALRFEVAGVPFGPVYTATVK